MFSFWYGFCFNNWFGLDDWFWYRFSLSYWFWNLLGFNYWFRNNDCLGLSDRLSLDNWFDLNDWFRNNNWFWFNFWFCNRLGLHKWLLNRLSFRNRFDRSFRNWVWLGNGFFSGFNNNFDMYIFSSNFWFNNRLRNWFFNDFFDCCIFTH